ncbi:MAG: hypothetical protein MPJ24_11085 [Pirellulaceae bacterium]|nr:hypothetical protein [Pirellulaceae bacterium]
MRQIWNAIRPVFLSFLAMSLGAMILQMVLTFTFGYFFFTEKGFTAVFKAIPAPKAAEIIMEELHKLPANVVTFFYITALTIDVVCAIFGGYLIVRLAPDDSLHFHIFMFLFLIASLGALVMDTNAGMPLWVPLGRILLCGYAIFGTAVARAKVGYLRCCRMAPPGSCEIPKN